MTLVAPEPAPLEVLGPRAVESVSNELEKAGVAVVSAARVEAERGATATLVLHPSEQRIEVGRVLALPALRGRPISGVPTDEARTFDPGSREDLAGLPGGRFLKAWLAIDDDEGLTTDLPSTEVPVLTSLARDLSAGFARQALSAAKRASADQAAQISWDDAARLRPVLDLVLDASGGRAVTYLAVAGIALVTG